MRTGSIAGTVCVLLGGVALLAGVTAADAKDVRVTAPAPGGFGEATRAPLTRDESAVLARALTFDPADPGDPDGRVPKKSLHMRGLAEPNELAVKRQDKADGSSSVAVKQPLTIDLETADLDAAVGADVNLGAAPVAGAVDDAGSGAAWASVGMANLASVDARVDPTSDQGKLAGTLKHSLPVGKDISVTLQDSYSVTQTFSASAGSDIAATSSDTATPESPTQVWANERSVNFAVKSTGTTLAAGLTNTSDDPVTHNRLSADQKIYGPLHVTTAVTDLGETSENRSISAGVMLSW
jgi:hypothetical protein